MNANDATNRLMQQQLQGANLAEPLQLGQGLGGAMGAGAQGGIRPENIAPNLEQVQQDTHVLQRGHRDITPDGGVGTVQEMLNRNGGQLAEDGIYGPLTEGAVEDFQRDNGLTVDGIVGDQTLERLEAADQDEMRDRLEQSGLPDTTRQDVLQRYDAAETAADRRGLYGVATSEGFRGLDEARQAEVLDAAAADLDNAQYTGQVQTLAQDPEFSALPAEARQEVFSTLAKHSDDPHAARTVSDLAGSAGFGELSAEERGRMLDYVGANTEFNAPEARTALDRVMSDPAFTGANAAGQAQQLRDFMRDQPGLPELVTYPEGHFDDRRREFEVGEPTAVANHQFRGSQEDALRYDVRIGDRTIPVYMPANQDPANGHFHSIDEVARGLAALPDAALDATNGVTVNPERNPDDAFWAQQYGDPGFRSYMTAGQGGQVTIYPTSHPISQTGMDSSLVHEAGHFVAHGQWGGDETQSSWDDYRAAIAADGIDVSGYGQNNEDEDFAETFKLYLGVQGSPQEAEVRAMYPNRFAIIDRILQGRN